MSEEACTCETEVVASLVTAAAAAAAAAGFRWSASRSRRAGNVSRSEAQERG